MRALLQRVSRAAVRVEGGEIARIGPGLLILIGVAAGDAPESADRLALAILKWRAGDAK